MAVEGKLVAQDANDGFPGVEAAPEPEGGYPFEIPEGWRWVTLKSVCNDVIVPQRDKPKCFDGDIPWCKIEDIEGDYLSGSRTGKTVTRKTVDAMNLKVYPTGTVLCSNSATIGVPAITTTELCTNQRFIGFVCGPELDNQYLLLLFKAFKGYLMTAGTGSTQSYIARKTFENMLIPLPSLLEQGRIVERSKTLLALMPNPKRAA